MADLEANLTLSLLCNIFIGINANKIFGIFGKYINYADKKRIKRIGVE